MTPPDRRLTPRHYVLGGLAALAGGGLLLFLLWDWNWFKPLVEARASATLGHPVHMDRLDVHPGRLTTLVGHGVHIGDGFGDQDVAVIPTLTILFEAETWLRTRAIVLPSVTAEAPVVRIIQTDATHDNYSFPALVPDPGAKPVTIGDLVITDGSMQVTMADPPADIALKFATSGEAGARNITLDGKGTYAKQPITVRGTGGALLGLRDAAAPYPVDLALTNGPTKVTLKGTVRDLLALGGADLLMTFSGPNMELLYPLTGIATPKTPPYNFAGKLDFVGRKYHLTDIKGRVGSTDLAGNLQFEPHGARPLLSGSLVSRQVDMQDLGGFVGSEPGRTTTPGQSPAQVAAVARAEADPKLLPDRPIDIPKLVATDVHLQFRGDKIIGKNPPFDSISLVLDINNGHIRLEPLKLTISGGTVEGYVDLNPVGDQLATDLSLTMQHVNLGGLLGKAGLGGGFGPVNGSFKLKGRGASTAAIVAQGDGALKIVMPSGGDVNSLLIDLSGLEIGRAILAALGVPDRETIRCLVADATLRHGVLISGNLAVDTSDHIITGGGRVDLTRELIELHLRTDAKHFTVGKLATPITIAGTFKKINYGIDAEALLRGGAAVGLGLLFPPAALLPTIQFGVGDASPCSRPSAAARPGAAAPAKPAAAPTAPRPATAPPAGSGAGR